MKIVVEDPVEGVVTIRGYLHNEETDKPMIHPSMVLKRNKMHEWVIAISEQLGDFEHSRKLLELYNAMYAKVHVYEEPVKTTDEYA